MAENSRVFNIQGNYIEHQEITVKDGGVLNFGASAASEPQRTAGSVDEVLQTAEATELLDRAKEHGWIDADMQPLVSQNKAAILASIIADELQLQPRWAAFEKLWAIDDLSNRLSKAQDCSYYPDTFKEMAAVMRA